MEPSNDDYSLEDQLSRLRHLLEQMQKGVGDFDEQLALFKEGQGIVKAARVYLDQAELQVQQLIDDEIKPFEPEE